MQAEANKAVVEVGLMNGNDTEAMLTHSKESGGGGCRLGIARGTSSIDPGAVPIRSRWLGRTSRRGRK
jgi:hypothetical protein